jgi:hypothetical protein
LGGLVQKCTGGELASGEAKKCLGDLPDGKNFRTLIPLRLPRALARRNPQGPARLRPP